MAETAILFRNLSGIVVASTMELLSSAKSDLRFYINGQEVSFDVNYRICVLVYSYLQVRVKSPDPEMTLLYYLRNNRILHPVNG